MEIKFSGNFPSVVGSVAAGNAVACLGWGNKLDFWVMVGLVFVPAGGCAMEKLNAVGTRSEKIEKQ